MSQEPSVEVFSKDTFLTSLRHGGGSSIDCSNGGGRSTLEEPPSMALVREKHAQLHDVVGSLSEKISAVLGRQEKDFLAAYRAHMYNVQKELHDLREKMQRNETVENKTEKIKKIEDERDWYRKEALRLDAFTTSMTKDLKYMREKLESIEEDRNWLEKQLKACKKQNKLLRAELDVRISAGVPTVNDTSVLPSFDSPKGANRRPSTVKRPSDGVAGLPNLGSGTLDPTVINPSAPLAEEREEKFRKQIRLLKKELHQKTTEVMALKRQRVAFAREHGSGTENDGPTSHLENFFLQCVESVKEEVQRRRATTHSQNADKTRVPSLSLADKVRNRKHDVGAEFEDFSSVDRVRVIERLLAHDQVLTFLYEQLFPPTPPPPQPYQLQQHQVRPATSTTGTMDHSSGERDMFGSDSTTSLPDARQSPPRRVSFEAGGVSTSSHNDPTSPTSRISQAQAAGSGAAAVSVVRSNTSTGTSSLPIDDSTREYLRSMRLSSS